MIPGRISKTRIPSPESLSAKTVEAMLKPDFEIQYSALLTDDLDEETDVINMITG
jgi:hypothetical protein